MKNKPDLSFPQYYHTRAGVLCRAVVNQAESIREQQREMSVRPEMARAAIEQSKPAPGQEIDRTVATVER